MVINNENTKNQLEKLPVQIFLMSRDSFNDKLRSLILFRGFISEK